VFEDAGVGGQLRRPVPQLGEIAPVERPPQGDHQRRRDVEVTGGPRCPPHLSEVADLREQAGGSRRLVLGHDRSVDPADQPYGPAQQAVDRLIELVRGREPVEPVAAQRVEHPVARHVGKRRDEHRRVDEVGDGGRRVDRRRNLESDSLRRVQVEAVGEHGQGTENALLVVGKQFVRPCDGGAQGAVMRVARRPHREHVEGSIQTAVEIGEAQRGEPACREFDRQRQAVEAAHDRGDGGRLRRPALEPGARLPGPLDE
jgi:hypothetical protein